MRLPSSHNRHGGKYMERLKRRRLRVRVLHYPSQAFTNSNRGEGWVASCLSSGGHTITSKNPSITKAKYFLRHAKAERIYNQ